MKYMTGGTDMWCPKCAEIRTCKAIPGAQVTAHASDYAQRFFHPKHPDLNWFQRGRQCLSCGHRFITGEMAREFLYELVELRDALADLKKHAETYASESEKASKSLQELTRSLSVLRALDIYKKV